ncbi:MAG: hypothetical protein K9L78_00345 [Victivallales bacterium]|nr:hypothetical protein [Victivallales bacterium]
MDNNKTDEPFLSSENEMVIDDCYDFINAIFESLVNYKKERYFDRTAIKYYRLIPNKINEEQFLIFLKKAITGNEENRKDFFRWLKDNLFCLSEKTAFNRHFYKKNIGYLRTVRK